MRPGQSLGYTGIEDVMVPHPVNTHTHVAPAIVRHFITKNELNRANLS
jgi:cytosine/adenosine deaminase-related metal-dependent hydrolase